MKGFMSDIHKGSALHAEWLGHPDFARFAGEAVREAERIVAEAERPDEVPLASYYCTWHRETPVEALPDCRDALAADLAAIMSELDRLAADAFETMEPWVDGDWAMLQRNRATLAAMDAK